VFGERDARRRELFVRQIPRHGRDVVATDFGGHVHCVKAGLCTLRSDPIDRVENVVDESSVVFMSESWIRQLLVDVVHNRFDFLADELVEVL